MGRGGIEWVNLAGCQHYCGPGSNSCYGATVRRFIPACPHSQIDGDIPLFVRVNRESSNESDGITECCWVPSLHL